MLNDRKLQEKRNFEVATIKGITRIGSDLGGLLALLKQENRGGSLKDHCKKILKKSGWSCDNRLTTGMLLIPIMKTTCILLVQSEGASEYTVARKSM